MLFRGERAPKSAIFWSKYSKKRLKTLFQNLACDAENLTKTGLLNALGELENQLGRPKRKGRQNFERFL